MRRLLVLLVVVALPATGVAAAQPVPDRERVVDLAFPVDGDVRFSDDYDQERGGGSRRHQATDLLGEKLLRLSAAVDGEVCYVNGIDEPMPTWGYALTVCGDDGLEYRYLHVNNDTPDTDDGAGGPGWAYAPDIARGVRVARGQWIAYMGDSGNAEETSPHLHFEIFDPELADPDLAVAPYQQGRRNPYPSLMAALDRGDVPGAAPAEEEDEDEDDGDDDREPEPEVEGAPVERVAGPTRLHTAAALAARRSTADTVIVAPAGSPAEALVAAPLAGLVGAPVLLAGPDGLDPDVLAEVERLGARSAYLVGRRDQLGDAVAEDLAAAGVAASARLAGADPAALSAAVLAEMATYEYEADGVVLALGTAGDPRAWPDALSASALAAHLRWPVLLSDAERLPEPVAAALAVLRPERITVVGGTAAISERVATRAAQAARGAQVRRLAGPDRYATSAAVATAAVAAGLDAPAVWVATGGDFPDALAAGPAAAREGASLLLVDGHDVEGSPASASWLGEAAGRVDTALVVGGPVAVAEPVRARVARLLAGGA